MAVIIKDEETDNLIRKLAERTGQSLTGAVKTAVREQLKRAQLTEDEIKARRRKLAKLLAEFDAIPTVDNRSEDEIFGYNERGTFD